MADKKEPKKTDEEIKKTSEEKAEDESCPFC